MLMFRQKLRIMMEAKMDCGMETAMIKGATPASRKSRIINPVRQAAMTASRITPFTEPRTKMD